jgi:hypothetical protein
VLHTAVRAFLQRMPKGAARAGNRGLATIATGLAALADEMIRTRVAD